MRHLLYAAAFSLAVPAAVALAAPRDSASVGVSLRMPLICYVDIVGEELLTDGTRLTLKEFCNTANGFSLWLETADLPRTAQVLYAGKPVERVGDRHVLVDLSGPRNRQSILEIISTEGTVGTAQVSLRFDPRAIR